MSKRSIDIKKKVDTDERIYYATQWQLVWWQFRKHKMALVGIVVLALMYTIAIAPGLFGPNDPNQRFTGYESSPPTPIRLPTTTC